MSTLFNIFKGNIFGMKNMENSKISCSFSYTLPVRMYVVGSSGLTEWWLFRLVMNWFEKPDGTKRTRRPMVLDWVDEGTCLKLRLENEDIEALGLWDREVLRGQRLVLLGFEVEAFLQKYRVFLRFQILQGKCPFLRAPSTIYVSGVFTRRK